MAKTIEQLKAQGAEVKNATVVGENTATRVGTLFTDIVEHVEQYETGQTVETEANTLAINQEAQARAKADEQLNTAIEAEITRAKAAEQANTTAIETETARAKAAEQANTTAIETETARAKAAEQVNATAIEEEKAAIMGTNRIAGGAITINKISDSAIDDYPTTGSNNLVKSGGVASAINDIDASTQAIAKIASKASSKLKNIKISEDKECIYKILEKDNLRFGVLGDGKGVKIEKIKHRTILDENSILRVVKGGINMLSLIPLDGINGIVGARDINNALPNFELKKDFQMTDGDIVYIPYTLSYADVTYSCNFTFENNFGTFTIGRGYNPNGNTIKHTYNAGWLEITFDKIYEKVRQFSFSDYPHTYKEYLHGLNLKSPISIIVQTRIGKGSIYESFITITNGDGQTFTIDKTGNNSDQRGITSSVGTTYIKCDSMDIHVNSFSFANARLKKEVWLYGDSYFGAYWRYLIGKRYGIDSYGQMFAGGENSESAINSLKFDIKHGCPRYILYGMGMNDGNDTELVNPTWKKNTEEFLDICDRYNISVTMLTVPNVRYEGVLKEDHRKLNEYIRNSGRHYIDVAAMMEDGDGNWYEGLISDTPTGDIHPSPKGSAIIAAAILSAFPQLSNEKFNI